MNARRRPAASSEGHERDRKRTTGQILEAVGRVLAEHGFEGLGVNAIAREASVDKVLVYRYFGGLPGLLEAFAAHGDHWPSADEVAGAASPDHIVGPAELGEGLVRFARALRKRPETQAILRWELHEHNELVDALAAARERMGLALLERIDAPKGLDVAAVTSVLAAGLTYLVLRAKTADAYNGIDLRSKAGWERLEDAVRAMVTAVAATPAKRGRKPRVPHV